MLHIGIALDWFVSLVKDKSSLLNDFEGFTTNFSIAFGEANKNMIANSKNMSLCQGSRSSFDYAFEFQKLL